MTFWTEPTRLFDRLGEMRHSERRLARGFRRALERLRALAEAGGAPSGSSWPAAIAWVRYRLPPLACAPRSLSSSGSSPCSLPCRSPDVAREEGEEALESVEGEPLHLSELIYNVAITRFLNPNDASDQEYLVGQPPEPPGPSYLAVFLLITNDSDDEAFQVADDFAVTDASGRVYEPLESEALRARARRRRRAGRGCSRARHDRRRRADPGAMLLFLVDDDVTEERPLELEIESSEGTGIVELDI